MDRRTFIQAGLIGTGSTLITPKFVLAGQQDKMAGGLYYTGDAPGRWSKKVQSHLPNIEVEKTPEGAAIQVVTRHTMEKYEHYIIKHILLDKNYRFIAENMFDPLTVKEPISVFKLEQYSGPVYALSVCNKHDTWLNVAEI
jgi:superoxide reductase